MSARARSGFAVARRIDPIRSSSATRRRRRYCRGRGGGGSRRWVAPARGRTSRARAEGGAPGLHEHVRHLGEIRVEVFRLRSRGGGGPGRRRVVSGRGVGAVFFRRVGDCPGGARESRRASARVAAHRLGRRHVLRLRLRLHRAERFLEAVRLEVRLDGGHEVGGVRGHRRGGGGFPRRRAAKECAAGAAAGAARLGAEKRRRRRRKKKAITKRTISHRNNLSPDCLPIRSTRVTSPAADALAREKATVHIARGRGKKGLRAALCGDAFSPPRVVAALPVPHSARRTFGAPLPSPTSPPPRAVAMSAAGYDCRVQLRGEYGTEPYWPEKKLKICVTGAGGFIASHLAKRLKEEGHHVVGCDWKRNEHMPVRHRARERATRARRENPIPPGAIRRRAEPARPARAFRIKRDCSPDKAPSRRASAHFLRRRPLVSIIPPSTSPRTWAAWASSSPTTPSSSTTRR